MTNPAVSRCARVAWWPCAALLVVLALPARAADDLFFHAVRVDDKGGLSFVAAVTDEGFDPSTATTTKPGIRVDGRPADVPADVAPAATGKQGTATMLAIDVSGSMAPSLSALKASLSRYIDGLREGVDMVGVGTIGDDWRVLQPLSADRAAARRAIEGLTSGRDKTTALFESVYEGTRLLERQDTTVPARRLLIVVTDGLNEKQGRSADECRDLARAAKIDVNSLLYIPVPTEKVMAEKGLLERISRDSGGLTRTAASPDQVQPAVDALMQSLRREVAIAIPGTSLPHDGKDHTLELTLARNTAALTWRSPQIVEAPATQPSPPAATEDLPHGRPGPQVLVVAGLALLLLAVVAALAARRRSAVVANVSEPSPSPMALTPPVSSAPAAFTAAPVAPALPSPASSAPARAAPRRTEYRPASSPGIAQGFALVPRAGLDDGQRRTLIGRSGLIGSAGDVDLVVAAPSVSGVHAEYALENDALLLRDCGSTNGTFVDGQRIGSEFVRVGRSSIVKIGLVAFVVE